MNGKEKLLVIGNGMGGGKLVEELLMHGNDLYEVTVIGEEPYDNYNRIKLVYKLKSDEVEDFFLTTKDWYESRGVKCILNNKAVKIHQKEKKVELKDSSFFSYDRLILAVGSKPFIPPINGLDLPGIMTMRTLEDVCKIKEMIRGKSQILVIGGGLLGLEQAIALKNMGKIVTVSHMMNHLMELQLHKEPALFLQKIARTKGPLFYYGDLCNGSFGKYCRCRGSDF